jgi:hypothetical protein
VSKPSNSSSVRNRASLYTLAAPPFNGLAIQELHATVTGIFGVKLTFSTGCLSAGLASPRNTFLTVMKCLVAKHFSTSAVA